MSLNLVGLSLIPNKNPEEIGVLPSKDQAQKMLWGLKDRFWMQFVDGKFLEYGSNVFDEGLHGGPVEPGFFGSLKSGCEFASEHLTERLTIQFYP